MNTPNKQTELEKEIARLKKLPQDMDYKNMCVFDEVRKLKAELKGIKEEQERINEVIESSRKEGFNAEEILTRLGIWMRKNKQSK